MWPWPNDLDTQTWPRYGQDVPAYQKWSFYVKGFKSYSLNRQTDRQTDTHTQRDRHDRKHYLPTYAGGNQYILISFKFLWIWNKEKSSLTHLFFRQCKVCQWCEIFTLWQLSDIYITMILIMLVRDSLSKTDKFLQKWVITWWSTYNWMQMEEKLNSFPCLSKV